VRYGQRGWRLPRKASIPSAASGSIMPHAMISAVIA
jgi:hypothetical protein